ncbi:MAG: hypothetical protein E6G39_10945 [Actinobacteria bacterium]|nr:MAG: hypothetical protein E6G39_10945 [Actinomycetota bacterium]
MESTNPSDLALEQRERLRDALVAFENALSAAGPRRAAAWAEGVVQCILRVETEFHAHVDFTEQEDGLYDDILAVAPRLAHRVDQLRQEHNEIAIALSDCLTRVELVPNTAHADWVTARREDCNALLGRLIRHRQRGADLVYEAYVEVGGSD